MVVVTSVLLLTTNDPVPGGRGSSPVGNATEDPLVVSTVAGMLRGEQDDDLRRWRGVPYAAAPVGDLRWRAPRAATPWSDVRDALDPGPPCLQPADYEYGAPRLTVRSGSSEDCLYLDVTAPADPAAADTRGAPVIVWLHGGGLFEGSGSTVDTSALARRGAVVVTVNYRLGRLGYFAHPALDQDVANFGLLDQMAALQWVRDNIAGFGGDPASVTVMGGSAGAISVNALMAAPSARGLFDRGDRPVGARRHRGAHAGRRTASGWSGLPGRCLPGSCAPCRPGTCSPPPSTCSWVTRRSSTPCCPSGSATCSPPGPRLRCPTSWAPPTRSSPTPTSGPSAPIRWRCAPASAVLGTTTSSPPTARRDFDDYVLDDLIFHAPAVSLALEHASLAPTFRYRFQPDPGGSTHGAEVPYVFGTEDRPGRRALTTAMGDYWVAFARTGVPRVVGLPVWPRATGTSYLELGAQGPRPVARDPWTPRLSALYDDVPLRLPGGRGPHRSSGQVSPLRSASDNRS